MSEQFKEKGNALFKAQDFAPAAEHYTLAIKALPHPVYFSNRAACYLKLGEYEKAAADCKAGLDHVPEFQKPRSDAPELKPDTPIKLFFRWSQALEDQHNYAAAVYVCNSGLKTYPGNESLTTQLKKLQWIEKKEKRDMKEKAFAPQSQTPPIPTPEASPTIQHIPIKVVNTLPIDLLSIYNTPETTDLLESPKLTKTTTNNAFPTSGSQLPLMLPACLNAYTLAQLLKSPKNQMEEVRSYLYNYDLTQWPHIFGRGGIDSDFIEEMLKAIEENADGPARPKEIVQSMKKCDRFNIANTFVPKDLNTKVAEICGESL
ncbi:Hsp70-Hsp90 organizing protein 1 [Yarrowia sp. B02]|nr:Hsp70-Hsp90 organizing protein 1 [Yarrowia sp. B02]